MSIVYNYVWLFCNIFVLSINCTIDIIILNYRGISVTWRRLLSNKSNEIHLEMFITLALSDRSHNLCDSHHNKRYEIATDYGIQCLDSWDNCTSWPFHQLYIECHSNTHDSPKSRIITEVILSFPPGLKSDHLFYNLQFPPNNSSCCWNNLDQSEDPVRLNPYLNLIKMNEINCAPIARFPEHISIDLNEDFIYSLHVFDPDGDLFQCSSLSSLSLIIIQENCIINVKSNSQISEHEILLKIEIIEYLNNKKDVIRSRLPYHIIAFIDRDQDENKSEKCFVKPLINLLNIENDLIHVLLNQSINLHLTSQSKCKTQMNECIVSSAEHWKIKSIIERTFDEDKSEIEVEFQWIPKTIEQCGFQIHCIRCFDQLDNQINKCINIYVTGPNCQSVNEICSWSPFSIWSKSNHTIYKRNRTCFEINNRVKSCPFCLGSSVQFQSSLTFRKDLELFEQSLLSPQRAQSTIKIILLVAIIWILSFILAISISIYYGIKTIIKRKEQRNKSI